jgi:hypothetical protein
MISTTSAGWRRRKAAKMAGRYSVPTIGVVAGYPAERGGRRGHGFGQRDQLQGDAGRFQTTLGAQEQRDADGRLQSVDMACQRRLGQRKAARRARQGTLLQHRQETAVKMPVGFGVHLFSHCR